MAKPMNEADKEKWAALHEKGWLWFVIRHGIMTRGLLFATLMALLNYFGFFGGRWYGLKTELPSFIVNALIFGIGVGWFEWRSRERRFQQAIGSSSPTV
jgi:hypothetical protein